MAHNEQTLSDWPVHGDDGRVVDVDDQELEHEFERVQRALGLASSERTVDRYRILAQLGKGGMGIVYAAVDPKLGRKVALKLVRARQRGSRTRLQARLSVEARALARLTHPNIVRVYDVGTDGDEWFVAMELIDGPTLLEWQEQQPRSIDELLAVYLQAAAGLEAVHHADIVHRDFKPDNVFVTSDGRVLVGDFGLANLDDSAAMTADSEPHPVASGLTETGAVLGTLGYMAPEQLRGDDVDARADQFAFCVALWEAITEQRPFAGTTAESLLVAIEGAELRGASQVPRRLRAILQRGLAFDRSARFADMRELIAAIAALDDRRPWWLSLGLGAAAIAAAVAVVLTVRDAAQPCDEQARIDQLWTHGRERVAEQLSRNSASVLQGRADAAVERLRDKADAVCREPSDERRLVLRRAIDELGRALAKPEALELDGWVMLIESLEALDLERPAIDPTVADAIDRSRIHEWYGEQEPAWQAADEAVTLAFADAPSGWSASVSEALVQRGRTRLERMEFEAALDDFAGAEAHAEGSGYGAQALRARLEAAAVLINFLLDRGRGQQALVRLEPLLHRHSRPLSPERARAHQLRSYLAAQQGEIGSWLGHAWVATFIHVVVHPDPLAASRMHLSFGVALAQLKLDDPALYDQHALDQLDQLPAGNAARLTAEYNQALPDIESDDPKQVAKGRAVLERLRVEGDHRYRVLATQTLLYLALREDDVEAMPALLDALATEPSSAEHQHVLTGWARLGRVDIETLNRIRKQSLDRGDVLALTNFEFDLAGALQLAACDLAAAGLARVDQIQAEADREQSRVDFERLLTSLDCR